MDVTNAARSALMNADKRTVAWADHDVIVTNNDDGIFLWHVSTNRFIYQRNGDNGQKLKCHIGGVNPDGESMWDHAVESNDGPIVSGHLEYFLDWYTEVAVELTKHRQSMH